MSLNYTGIDPRVQFTPPSGAAINNLTAFTFIKWVYTDSSATAPQVYALKGAGDTGRKSLERKFGDVNDFDSLIMRATTNAVATTTGVNKPLNSWFFVALTYDETDGPRIFTGDLTTAAVEAAYSTRTVGAGATNNDDLLPLTIGNRTDFNEPMLGRSGLFRLVSKRLSLAEIRALQFSSQNTPETEVLYLMGSSGIATQVDLSGNGYNGTITGLTQADAVPLPSPFGFAESGIRLGSAASSITLSVDDISHSLSFDNVALTQKHALLVDDITHSVSFESPTLIQGFALAVNDINHAVSFDTPALTQKHSLTVSDISHSIAFDSPTLVQGFSLTVADVNHAVLIDSPTLTQGHSLAVDDISHSLAFDNVTLTQKHALLVDDIAHAMLMDNVSLILPGGLLQGKTIMLNGRGVDFTLETRRVDFNLTQR